MANDPKCGWWAGDDDGLSAQVRQGIPGLLCTPVDGSALLGQLAAPTRRRTVGIIASRHREPLPGLRPELQYLMGLDTTRVAPPPRPHT